MSFKEPTNDQQKRFIELLVDGKLRVPEAAKEAGYVPEYGYVLVKQYKEYFLDRVLSKLVLATPAAANILIEGVFETDPAILLTHGYKKDFAKEILDRAGVVKRDKLDVTVEAAQGLLILPAKEAEGEAVNG